MGAVEWEGAGLGARASRAPLAASHPLPTSAHLPRGPATCAGCSRPGGSREERRGFGEGTSSAEVVFPGFLPAGGLIHAQLLHRGSRRPGSCAGSRIRMVPLLPRGFWSTHNPLHRGLPWLDTALVSHQPQDKSPCLTPSPGPKGHQCWCGCHRVWRDEGFGEAQTAAPEEHIHMLRLGTALLAIGSSWDLAFHPFLGPGGAEGGDGTHRELSLGSGWACRERRPGWVGSST